MDAPLVGRHLEDLHGRAVHCADIRTMVDSYYLTQEDKRVAFHFGEGVRPSSPSSMSLYTVLAVQHRTTVTALAAKPCGVPTTWEIR